MAYKPELWAEAKKGAKAVLEESFVQLVITIGKAHTFEHHLPPRFLGAFDAEKIAFIPYNNLLEIFHQNDFNWNWFRIYNTFRNNQNNLTISIPCIIKIKYSPIVKVGL